MWSGTTRSLSPPFRRGRSGTRCSGWRATSSSRAPRRSTWSSGGTSAGCSFDGCSRRRRSRPCSWTSASRRSSASPTGGPAPSSPRSGSSFAEPHGTSGCTRSTSAARRGSTAAGTRSCSGRRTSIGPSSRTTRSFSRPSRRSSRPSWRRLSRRRRVAEQVKGVLKRLLAGRRPGVEDVARELRLSSRTLQRRLTDAGATFQQLTQEARRELARHYLLHSSLELNQTAYLLGYEDAHSFFRAFHDWEGSPPGEWRARHTRPLNVTDGEYQSA